MSTTETIRYNDRIVRDFIFATIIFGLVGMLVGLIIAVQLFWPAANLNLPWTTFGRLRPLHTNAVIFAFCGNAIFAGIYYSSQRLLKARMASDFLSRFHFWGWQAIIVSAAITLPLGLTTSKEYAELEWPIDIAITIVWLAFGINLIWTAIKRREPTMYVSIWFYIATFLAVAMLHVVNSLSIPVSLFKSYPIYKGVQDALVQWWYGHNAVAFFLTTPFLGLAYYFIPKSVEKPIYSYRLSIIHFWSLIFIYIWAGPHHLQYSSLPEWLQSLGMVFSVMLLAPSWGGAINFVLTLRNGWDRVRAEAIPKFFVAATTFYMMATFEGPLLSIKSVNAISHNTDWTIGHVHSGALGWNGLLIFGMIYWLVPRLYKTKLYSETLATVHFWIATAGIALYIVSMWISGVMQGLMGSAVTDKGVLAYPNYLEIVTAVIPLHMIRAVGGFLYLSGLIILVWNVWKTISLSPHKCTDTEVRVPSDVKSDAAVIAVPTGSKKWVRWQAIFENRSYYLVAGSLIAVAIGGLVEIIPIMTQTPQGIMIPTVTPWTALEIGGRDIYIREGCNNCHTQQIRPILGETMRYGPYSKAGEFVYDTPHLWGSKRTGPDLARIGHKYGDVWHWKHMVDPRLISAGSVMPNYPWLITSKLNFEELSGKLKALRIVGIPYSEIQIQDAEKDARAQAAVIASGLVAQGEIATEDQELVALIAYLQRLGMDGRNWDQPN